MSGAKRKHEATAKESKASEPEAPAAVASQPEPSKRAPGVYVAPKRSTIVEGNVVGPGACVDGKLPASSIEYLLGQGVLERQK